MSSCTFSSMGAVTVLPRRATRRVTRRDGVLPMVLVLELLTGIAFGVAGTAGGTDAVSASAGITLGPAPVVTVMPSTRPVAQVLPAAPVVPTHAARDPFGPVAPHH